MKIVEILEKIVEMHRIFFFNFCVYKMVEIIKEAWGRNGVEVIVFNDKSG